MDVQKHFEDDKSFQPRLSKQRVGDQVVYRLKLLSHPEKDNRGIPMDVIELCMTESQKMLLEDELYWKGTK